MPPSPLPPLLLFAKTLALTHLFTTHLLTIERTTGPSMLPTLSVQGDSILVSARQRRGRGVRVGDVVALRHPVPAKRGRRCGGIVKRVVGLGGDFVSVGGGEMMMMMKVPEGHCWLLGDNLPESRDSRTYGPVPLALVQGRVVAKVWPLGEMKWIGNALESVAGGGDGDGDG